MADGGSVTQRRSVAVRTLVADGSVVDGSNGSVVVSRRQLVVSLGVVEQLLGLV